ncbi:MAG TPA: type II toxin-antitoxin system death-on-curing family toxin [Verrucomicrobiae bacterium]|nr:type II toxin-antitoxin system death-on-curing family toxin [Verrucomicrobiae bacterium]
MSEPRWLRGEIVVILHGESLEEHGGLEGLRDEGLLESALARPQNLLHYERTRDLCRLAAAYAHGIARNHPFNDGNKRAAFIAAIVFLRINGARFNAPQVAATQAMLRLASGEMSEGAFARWLSLQLGKAGV